MSLGSRAEIDFGVLAFLYDLFQKKHAILRSFPILGHFRCIFESLGPELRPHSGLIHFTPTHVSWLNQIEIWFCKLKRDVLARGIFKSVKDLDRKIMKLIRSHNKTTKPYKWTSRDVSKKVTPAEPSVAVHQDPEGHLLRPSLEPWQSEARVAPGIT